MLNTTSTFLHKLLVVSAFSIQQSYTNATKKSRRGVVQLSQSFTRRLLSWIHAVYAVPLRVTNLGPSDKCRSQQCSWELCDATSWGHSTDLANAHACVQAWPGEATTPPQRWLPCDTWGAPCQVSSLTNAPLAHTYRLDNGQSVTDCSFEAGHFTNIHGVDTGQRGGLVTKLPLRKHDSSTTTSWCQINQGVVTQCPNFDHCWPIHQLDKSHTCVTIQIKDGFPETSLENRQATWRMRLLQVTWKLIKWTALHYGAFCDKRSDNKKSNKETVCVQGLPAVCVYCIHIIPCDSRVSQV